jgi:hypothetical protein
MVIITNEVDTVLYYFLNNVKEAEAEGSYQAFIDFSASMKFFSYLIYETPRG